MPKTRLRPLSAETQRRREVNTSFNRRFAMAMAKIRAKVVELTLTVQPGERIKMSDRTYEVHKDRSWRRVA